MMKPVLRGTYELMRYLIEGDERKKQQGDNGTEDEQQKNTVGESAFE